MQKVVSLPHRRPPALCVWICKLSSASMAERRVGLAFTPRSLPPGLRVVNSSQNGGVAQSDANVDVPAGVAQGDEVPTTGYIRIRLSLLLHYHHSISSSATLMLVYSLRQVSRTDPELLPRRLTGSSATAQKPAPSPERIPPA